jgi:hypothetical protein
MFDSLIDVTEKASTTLNKTLDLIETSLDIANNELLEIRKTQEIRKKVLDSDSVKKKIKENMKLELELKISRKKSRLTKLSDKYK